MEDELRPRKPYPSDVSDEEWAFVAPYLTLMTPDAPQRRYELREVFTSTRWIVRAGAPWRMLPTNLPPWEAVYQPTIRWINAGVFAEMTHDLRALLRWMDGRDPEPSAVIFDGTTRHRRRRAALVPDMTAPSAGKAARCLSPSILWGTCWRCM